MGAADKVGVFTAEEEELCVMIIDQVSDPSASISDKVSDVSCQEPPKVLEADRTPLSFLLRGAPARGARVLISSWQERDVVKNIKELVETARTPLTSRLRKKEFASFW